MSWLENPKAFARPASLDGDGYPDHAQPGMTLRDWFAGQAFAACFTNATGFGDISPAQRDAQFAELAAVIYVAADAMLAARQGDAA